MSTVKFFARASPVFSLHKRRILVFFFTSIRVRTISPKDNPLVHIPRGESLQEKFNSIVVIAKKACNTAVIESIVDL